MDKSLLGFLNPARKENLKMVVSDAFKDETGKPLVWVLRELPSKEALEISRNYANNIPGEVLAAQIAQACVVPPLRDKEFLEALSKREGRTILKPLDALLALMTNSEYATLATAYMEYCSSGSFPEQIEEAKN